MTKAEKKIWNIIKNAGTGVAVGTGVTIYWAAAALVAPIAYPVHSALMGLAISKANECHSLETAALTVSGFGLGLVLIPAAPINFLCSPVAIPLGAAMGGLVGHVENQKEKK